MTPVVSPIKVYLIVFFLFFALSNSSFALNENLNKAYAHYMMGYIYDQHGQIEEAVKEYEQAKDIDFNSPDIHLRLGIDYIKLKEFSLAEEELKLTLKLAPDFLEASFLLALIYTSEGKIEQAAGEYENLLQKSSALDPRNMEIQHGLAQLYYYQKKYDDAIQKYRFILSVNPKDLEALFYLGSLYEETGKRAKAIEAFKKAIKIDPRHADSLNSLGYIYAEEGIKLQEAKDFIMKALESDPDNAAYIDSLGWVYFKQGHIEQAIKELERAVSLLDDPVIVEHLGDAYNKKGLLNKAVDYWEKSLELDPDRQEVRDKIEKAINKIK